MALQTRSKRIVSHLSSHTAVRCPSQLLVIDRLNGPADVLVSTLSLLLDREVSVTLVEDHGDALRALGSLYFDLVVVGLEANQARQLTILPYIQNQNHGVPMMVVGRNLPRLYRQYARHHGVCEVLNVPERAADLKALVSEVAQHYLRTSCGEIKLHDCGD